jgi:hypothetical protein
MARQPDPHKNFFGNWMETLDRRVPNQTATSQTSTRGSLHIEGGYVEALLVGGFLYSTLLWPCHTIQ